MLCPSLQFYRIWKIYAGLYKKNKTTHSARITGKEKKAVILEIILTGQNHDCVSCSAKVCYHTVHLLKISWKEYFIQSYTREVAMRWSHWYPRPNKGNVQIILSPLIHLWHIKFTRAEGVLHRGGSFITRSMPSIIHSPLLIKD